MARLLSPLAVSFGAHVAIAAALLGRPAAGPPSPPSSPGGLAGETFELPAPEPAGAEPGPATPAAAPPMPAAPAAPAAPADPTEREPGHGEAPARPPTAPPRARAAPAAGAAGAPGGTGSDARFGALGDRAAADLATAFTRGFPQAASADPAWRSAGLGAAGAADVVITLSAAGTIEATRVEGAPSPALASGIRRTLALLGSRPFVARGRTTTLHVVASVSPDTAHDGLHGDVFALGGSFTGGEGNAFFALAIGRRIDLRVRQR